MWKTATKKTISRVEEEEEAIAEILKN